jgi:hypothetical protein
LAVFGGRRKIFELYSIKPFLLKFIGEGRFFQVFEAFWTGEGLGGQWRNGQ